MANPKANATTFKRGRKKTGGRKRGTPNRNTRILGEAIVAAAEAAGSERGKDGLFQYFKKLAKEQPAIFVPLLGKLITPQFESRQTSTIEVIYRTPAEIRQELDQHGLLDFLLAEPSPFDDESGDAEGEADKEEVEVERDKEGGNEN
jgi:hypothetical protein